MATSFDGFVLKYELGSKKSVAYCANTLGHARDYDVAQAFRDDTGWTLRPGQAVGDFAHGLFGVLHCSPRGELARAFRAWRKAHRKPKGGLL